MNGWSKGLAKSVSSLFLFLNIYFGGIHLYRLRFVAQNIVSVIHERKKRTNKKKTFLMVFNGQKRHKKNSNDSTHTIYMEKNEENR